MFNDCGLELTYFPFTIIEIIIIGLLHIIACNNGTFGHNCSEQCGSCVKGRVSRAISPGPPFHGL